VSSAEQIDGKSLAVQEAERRAFCARNGWTVAEVFVEKGESAKTTDRL